MTQIALSTSRRPAIALAPVLFPAAVFMSASLTFFVEPMIGKLTLPLLGGSPAVWNTSLAFFQAALLLGYLYAHALQRIASVRTQALVHVGMLLAAALTLPLRLSGLLGEPPVGAPTLWLLGELALTIGAPFAALSATAPLLQAWQVRRMEARDAGRAYSLYAASNLGSLLALTAYPFIVEPNLTLPDQRWVWTLGYGLFVLLAAGVALSLSRAPAAVAPRAAAPTTAPTWRTRLIWIGLAAAPSSLMLGVTTHLTSNVGSTPFLWVAPLGLYLLTFVIAFRGRPAGAVEGSSRLVLGLQAAAMIACVIAIGLSSSSWLMQLGVNLAAFFLTALVCHQALVARRPSPERLTEFYLLISLGGVIGGSFNAFLAPALFPNVWEYPLVLVLANLARPWGVGRIARRELLIAGGGLVAAAAVAGMIVAGFMPAVFFLLALIGMLGCAWISRTRAPLFAGVIAGVALAAQAATALHGSVVTKRSFFGVHHVLTTDVAGLGPVRELIHGSTLHGAQQLSGDGRCTTMTYYAPAAPIGRTFATLHASKPAANIGVVGLGTGAVAALTAPGDTLRFYEIDPAVLAIARDDGLFSFVGACARGRIDYVMGDGRLTLGHTPRASLDMLVIDAFSSDSVPTHLLTTEAMGVYLAALKPDGVLVLHLSNRNLNLVEPASAAVLAAGAQARVETFKAPQSASPSITSSAVLVASRSSNGLAAYAADPRWRPADAKGVRPWTDDYTNVLGALLAKARGDGA